MKLVSFLLMLTVVLLEAKLNPWENLALLPVKVIFNYLYPKDPGIVRVRKPDEIKTEVNSVTTLDFVSATRLLIFKSILDDNIVFFHKWIFLLFHVKIITCKILR